MTSSVTDKCNGLGILPFFHLKVASPACYTDIVDVHSQVFNLHWALAFTPGIGKIKYGTKCVCFKGLEVPSLSWVQAFQLHLGFAWVE